MLKEKILSLLELKISKAKTRFPDLFGYYLPKIFQQVIANTSANFFSSRTPDQLFKILITQAYLQKLMVASLNDKDVVQHPIFLKLFTASSHMCIALCCHESTRIKKSELIATLKILLPGIQEIPGSFYFLLHPDLPYQYCYIEIRKLRGESLSKTDLKVLESSLKDQLILQSPLTPTLFWPYNEEESIKEVRQLVKEIQNAADLPQVTIHFQEQTPWSLEFLIHLARPKNALSIYQTLEFLPNYIEYHCHFERHQATKLPVDMSAFTLKIPSKTFEARDSINLLYARRYIFKYLEAIFGPCRDYNGGLFEKQQQHFERIRIHLGNKIPHFDIFAEKLFYAICPVEKRLMLPLDEAETIFRAFSNLINDKKLGQIKYETDNIIIYKGKAFTDLPSLKVSTESMKNFVYATLYCCGFYYKCILASKQTTANSLIRKNVKSHTKTLRLVFDEGAPASLNPHHTSGDMRCRPISKLLFEGLTRLDANGNPALAGAEHIEISPCGRFYNFKLRSHCWSNGESVTTFDYVTSLKGVLSSFVSHPEIYFSIKNAKKFIRNQIEIEEIGIRAFDENTMQIELEHPDHSFLKKLSQPSFFPLFGPLQEPKWFNGPYLLHEQNKEFILLKRNPYYWNQKEQYFEEIDFQWHNNPSEIYNLFKEHKINWIGDPLYVLSPNLIQQLENENQLQSLSVQRDFLLYFKTTHYPLSSPWIRQALSLAVDRSLICKDIYPYCKPLLSGIYQHNEANILFEKGLQELGLTRKTFPSLTFSYSHQERRDKLASYLQKAWKEVLGVSVNLNKSDWNLFRHQLEKGYFEICCTMQRSIDKQSPDNFKKLEGSSSWNFANWDNQNYRKIVSTAIFEQNPEKQQALLAQGSRILNEQVPFSPLFQYTHLFACSQDLKGYIFDEEGCVDFSNAHY